MEREERGREKEGGREKKRERERERERERDGAIWCYTMYSVVVSGTLIMDSLVLVVSNYIA